MHFDPGVYKCASERDRKGLLVLSAWSATKVSYQQKCQHCSDPTPIEICGELLTQIRVPGTGTTDLGRMFSLSKNAKIQF